jgi:hypothetical protein
MDEEFSFDPFHHLLRIKPLMMKRPQSNRIMKELAKKKRRCLEKRQYVNTSNKGYFIQ